MSNYENQPPQNPYGEQQPGQPYAQPGYDQPGYAQPTYGQPAAGYAHWGKRVGANLIDGLVMTVAMIPYIAGFVIATANSTSTDINGNPQPDFGAVSLSLIALGVLLGIAVFIWNICLKGGKTGWTIGKGVLGIRLLKEQTGQPVGAGMAFVRQIAHVLDALPCYLGFLWPLWDTKRQTFADKIVGSVVINQPKEG